MALSSALYGALGSIIFTLAISSVLPDLHQAVLAQNQQLQQSPDTLEKNKRIIVSFVKDVLNDHNLTALDKYYSPNAIQHNPIAAQGSQGFKRFFAPFFSA